VAVVSTAAAVASGHYSIGHLTAIFQQLFYIDNILVLYYKEDLPTTNKII
jgi:hypothetical protein